METASVKEHKIRVIGIGPGSPDYLLPAAAKAIENAKVLVGGRRALGQYARLDGSQHTFPITNDIPAVMDFIKHELAASDVGVLVSGDPGYYSLLDALRREYPAEQIEVIPGLSSMQLAFARLALPWHGACFLSFHGRRPEQEELCYRPGRILGLLTDGKYNSRSIAQILMEAGWPGETRLSILLRLSYPDEEVITTTLNEASKMAEKSHGILIIQG